jgi:N-acylglucosamine-6-phosphate 2-epimerase
MKQLRIIKGSLIVSCQALEDEPLHSPYIMSKMALAAFEGGAKGIRANSKSDIVAIKNEVDLPIIGIIKCDYVDSDVRITPTEDEIQQLYNEGVDIIAFDATDRIRPGGVELREFLKKIRAKYPDQIFMADVSNLQEAVIACEYGIDIVATTLVGYTDYTLNHDTLRTLKEILREIPIPVIAEGNINTPEKAKSAIQMGAFAVVVGSAITRPQMITKEFIDKMSL